MNFLLAQDFIKEHFTQPNPSNSHHLVDSISFDVEQNNQETLLITIGDSWTWGDELIDRKVNCYPHLLSQGLQSDLLNLGCPGIGNHYISLLFQEVSSIKDLLRARYSKIYCVIVLTEIGREFNSDFDNAVDYASWLRNNITCAENYNDFLLLIDKPAVEKIVPCEGLQIYVGYNFIDPVYQDIICNTYLDKTWLEVTTNYEYKNCYCVSPWLIQKLETVFSMEWTLDRSIFRQWQLNTIAKAQNRLNLLSNPTYYHPLYHPNNLGHRRWSDYILGKIKNDLR